MAYNPKSLKNLSTPAQVNQPGVKTGPRSAARLQDPAVYKLRAMEMLRMRILGNSLAKIGQHFNVSPYTVVASLQFAVREGIVEQYEQTILNSLVPDAINVYRAKLADSDDPDSAMLAKDVLGMLLKLGDRYQDKQTSQQEMGLKQYLATKAYDTPRHTASLDGLPVMDPTTNTPIAAGEYLGELSPGGEPDAEAISEADLDACDRQIGVVSAPTHAFTPTNADDAAIVGSHRVAGGTAALPVDDAPHPSHTPDPPARP